MQNINQRKPFMVFKRWENLIKLVKRTKKIKIFHKKRQT